MLCKRSIERQGHGGEGKQSKRNNDQNFVHFETHVWHSGYNALGNPCGFSSRLYSQLELAVNVCPDRLDPCHMCGDLGSILSTRCWPGPTLTTTYGEWTLSVFLLLCLSNKKKNAVSKEFNNLQVEQIEIKGLNYVSMSLLKTADRTLKNY